MYSVHYCRPRSFALAPVPAGPDAKFAWIFGVIHDDGGHEESMFSPSRDEYGKGL